MIIYSSPLAPGKKIIYTSDPQNLISKRDKRVKTVGEERKKNRQRQLE